MKAIACLVAAALALSACSSTDSTTTVSDVESKLDTATLVLSTVEVARALYPTFKPCGTLAAGPICYDPTVAAAADKIISGLDTTIATARAALAAIGTGGKPDLPALVKSLADALVKANQILVSLKG